MIHPAQIDTVHTVRCSDRAPSVAILTSVNLVMLSSGRRGFQMKLKWIAFALVVGASFVVLLGVGVRIYQEAPPIASEIVTPDGELVIPARTSRPVRTSGSRWVEWRWDRSGVTGATSRQIGPPTRCIGSSWRYLNDWARQESATDYDALPSERQAALRDRLTSMIRTNTLRRRPRHA